MLFTRRNFVSLFTSAATVLGLSRKQAFAAPARESAPSDPATTIWLRQPSAVWMDALPIGNGRMGAMVFGGIVSERLALNEDTLWSGLPRDCNNPAAKDHLPAIRKFVLEDKNYHAADLETHKMNGPWNESYLPLGDLIVDFNHGSDASSYRRSLDLDSAVASASYRIGDVLFRRESFASFPDDVIVLRLAASKPGALDATIRFNCQLQSNVTADAGILVLSGKAPKRALPNYINTEPVIVYSDTAGEGMNFASVAVLKTDGGTLEPQHDGSMRVHGASSLLVVIGCATGFRNFAVAPDTPLDAVIARARAAATKAAAKPYAELLQTHIADHRVLFRRVNLELPATSDSDLATDQRVEAFAKAPDDPSLAVLLFNLGRYLLIASSRPGSQPGNLQGIWSADLRPAWSCNWTANINVQMNYWPAETCNLSELHMPLVEMVRDLSVNGTKTAGTNYGTSGWCSHHNIDLWRQSAPVGDGQDWALPTWTTWCMSGQWLCAHLWDHYAFTLDKAYLRDVYPVLRGSAEFCAGWLIDDGHGGLTTCPSLSPENEFIAPNGKVADVSSGTTMDMALTREIFAHCIEAATVLGLDPDLRAKLTGLTARLPPYGIGPEGQLLEWSPGLVGTNPGTGHMSPLYPLYPGTEITPRGTPELASAARKLLESRMTPHRGPGKALPAGWPGAWAAALWTRLEEGNIAWELVQAQLVHDANCNLFNDCFDTHPPALGGARRPAPPKLFQIDGNLGSTAAMAEMLLQSHGGEIAFLPALPDAWTRGKVKGLKARGGLETAIEWSAGRPSTATVQASIDGEHRFRAPHGHALTRIAISSGGHVSSYKALPLPSGDLVSFTLALKRNVLYRLTFARA